MSRPAPFHVFTPQRDKPEELEQILVKRHALLESAVDKIRESVLMPDKHRLLFVGPRGMGKSYLVTLIHHRLSIQKELSEKMRFAWLNEDQTSTTFLHLLMRIYRKLVDQYPEEFSASELEAIRGKEPADARELLGQSLIRQLKNRTVVLLIENLDAIFSSMRDIEQRTWRGFLQDHPSFAIVGTAQGLTKDISSKEKPFFGFFNIHHLEALSVDEAAELLGKIATLNDNPSLAEFIASARGKARMRAIHHLSGGNPRLYIILSDFLTKDSLDDLVRLFEETVDRQLTPYFQERMRWLSPQQQEIVQFLCQQVHPASVKEIAQGIFVKQNTLSSQLKQLREKSYLVSKSRGKESLYELAEPLMRLSFQVKEMNHRQPLTLIVDFMRVWYDRLDLENRLSKISPGTWGRDYFEEALHKINTEGNAFRHSLMLACIDDIDLENCDVRQLEELRAIAEETASPQAWLKYGLACFALDELEKSVEALSLAIDSSKLSTIELWSAHIIRAEANFKLGNFKEANDGFTRALDEETLDSEILIEALLARGVSRAKLGQHSEAVLDFGRLVEKEECTDSVLVSALACRADSFSILENHQAAVDDWEQVVSLEPVSNAHVIRGALLGLAKTYLELGQDEKSVNSIVRLLKNPESPDESKKEIQVEVGMVLTAIAFNLREKPEVWMALIKKVIPLLVENGYEAGLNFSVVQSLEQLKESELNSVALKRWAAEWEEVFQALPAFQLGVRMLKAGIAWIVSKEEGVLLELVREERDIVRQVLNLKAEK